MKDTVYVYLRLPRALADLVLAESQKIRSLQTVIIEKLSKCYDVDVVPPKKGPAKIVNYAKMREYLALEMAYKVIAKRLGCHHSTVAKEARRLKRESTTESQD